MSNLLVGLSALGVEMDDPALEIIGKYEAREEFDCSNVCLKFTQASDLGLCGYFPASLLNLAAEKTHFFACPVWELLVVRTSKFNEIEDKGKVLFFTRPQLDENAVARYLLLAKVGQVLSIEAVEISLHRIEESDWIIHLENKVD